MDPRRVPPVRRDVELLRRVVVLRPPRFAVERFAVERFAVERFAVERFAVVLRRAVPRFAVVLRPALAEPPPDFLRPVARLPPLLRRVVRRPPSDDEPLIDEGMGGVGLDGIGVGHTEPGSFCSDQSVP